jgi:DNA-directed RNA polymerase subunit omega
MEQRKEYYKDPLTNEKIVKKFESQFDLVNYAIRLAENMIYSGRDSRVKIDCQNRALQILGEIALGKDIFDEIIPHHNSVQDVQQETRYSTRESREPREESSSKGEKKRPKKSLIKD